MTVLWVVNICFGPLQKKSVVASGGWLEAAYDSMKEHSDINLVIATVGNNGEIVKERDGRHVFYKLPGGYPAIYNLKSKKSKSAWIQLKQENQIDVIQIWGTEYAHGILALEVFDNIPAVIYMQGLMQQIARHYVAGLSFFEQIKHLSFRDTVKFDWIPCQKRKYENNALREARMLQIAKNIIVENQWCADHCQIIAPGCHIHKAHLNIRSDFYNSTWNIGSMSPHTILCNAGGYPLKGFHVLLRALAIVVEQFPDTKLYVPGGQSPFGMSLFRITSYHQLLKKLILKLSLKDNIKFLPSLSAAQMAEQMVRANVFVMPSCIENHSSTLIEAMMVGTPCVASAVGGIPEYVMHQRNALLYRFEEYEMLASHIMKIFRNRDLAQSLSIEAKNMKYDRSQNDLKEELMQIYLTVSKHQ